MIRSRPESGKGFALYRWTRLTLTLRGTGYTTYVTHIDNATGELTTSDPIPGTMSSGGFSDTSSTITTYAESSNTSYATTIDTATGETTTLGPVPGRTYSFPNVEDNTTTLLSFDQTSSGYVTYMTRIDNTTGESVTSDPIVGSPSRTISNGNDTTTVITQDYRAGTGYVTYATVVDASGAASTSHELPGQLQSLNTSSDGATTVVSTSIGSTYYTTVVNNTTGDATTLLGYSASTPLTTNEGHTTIAYTSTSSAGATQTSINVIDNDTGEVTTSTVNGFLTDIEDSEGVRSTIVTTEHYDSQTQTYSTLLTRIDADTGEVVVSEPIPGNQPYFSSTYDYGAYTTTTTSAYTSGATVNYFTVIDNETGRTTTVPGTGGTVTTSADGATATIVSYDGDYQTGYTAYVTHVDTETGVAVTSDPIPGYGVYLAPTDDGTTTTLVTYSYSSTPFAYFNRIDNVSGEVTTTEVRGQLYGATASDDGTTTTLTSYDSATRTTTVRQIDNATGEVALSASAQGSPYGQATIGDDGFAYIYTASGGTVYLNRVDLATGDTSTSVAP